MCAKDSISMGNYLSCSDCSLLGLRLYPPEQLPAWKDSQSCIYSILQDSSTEEKQEPAEHQVPVILALKCDISRRGAETQRKNILNKQDVINPEEFFTHFFAPLRDILSYFFWVGLLNAAALCGTY